MITVKMDDGTEYTINTLLGKGDTNAKLAKSDKASKEYLTFGLSLAPAYTSGYQVCASSSPGCRAACLFTSGLGKVHSVQRARIAKTRAYFQNKKDFMDMLRKELHAAAKKANKENKHAAVRLNVLSDIQWENRHPDLFTEFSDIQFYDYTKHVKRAERYTASRLNGDDRFPLNYHLTFSRSECNQEDCLRLLDMGMNVTVVFNNKELPEWWNGYKVVNGDETDLRFLDPENVVVGLYAKGYGKGDKTGFVVSLPML